MEQSFQVLILQKEELVVVSYNTGESYCLPIFFFLCFIKTGLKECQKIDEVGKKSRMLFFIGLSIYLKIKQRTAGCYISRAIWITQEQNLLRAFLMWIWSLRPIPEYLLHQRYLYMIEIPSRRSGNEFQGRLWSSAHYSTWKEGNCSSASLGEQLWGLL